LGNFLSSSQPKVS